MFDKLKHILMNYLSCRCYDDVIVGFENGVMKATTKKSKRVKKD